MALHPVTCIPLFFSWIYVFSFYLLVATYYEINGFPACYDMKIRYYMVLIEDDAGTYRGTPVGQQYNGCPALLNDRSFI